MKKQHIRYNTKLCTIADTTVAGDQDFELITKSDSEFVEAIAFIERNSGLASGDMKYTIAIRNMDTAEDILEPCPKDLLLNSFESAQPANLSPEDRFHKTFGPLPAKGTKYRIRITTPATCTEDLNLHVTFKEVRPQV
jgi:hypothetical protein